MRVNLVRKGEGNWTENMYILELKILKTCFFSRLAGSALLVSKLFNQKFNLKNYF